MYVICVLSVCHLFAICLPGTKLANLFPPSTQFDRYCTVCPYGYYSDAPNLDACIVHRQCPEGGRTVRAPTRTSQRECEMPTDCEAGFYEAHAPGVAGTLPYLCPCVPAFQVVSTMQYV